MLDIKLSIKNDLCKGTGLQIIKLLKPTIYVTGDRAGKVVFLPRI